jgi:head-tail adaptor
VSLARLLARTVTIKRAGSTTDRYGASVKNWNTATTTATTGWLSQASSVEVNDLGREGQESLWTLVLPVDTDILGGDRVTIEGTTYEVDGPPNRAWTPRGEHHVEARLKLVQG